MSGSCQIAILRHQFSTAQVTVAASVSVITDHLKAVALTCSYFSGKAGSQILTRCKSVFCWCEEVLLSCTHIEAQSLCPGKGTRADERVAVNKAVKTMVMCSGDKLWQT